jgi:hypothetical protein
MTSAGIILTIQARTKRMTVDLHHSGNEPAAQRSPTANGALGAKTP